MNNQPKLAGVKVGDTLFIRGSNERLRGDEEPPTVTVTKVGPKRVGFDYFGRTCYANIQTGAMDDWGYLQTREVWQAQNRRKALVVALAAQGVTLNHTANGVDNDALCEILHIIKGTT